MASPPRIPRVGKAPAPAGAKPPPSPPPGPSVPLRLAIGKEGLGLELASAVELGPLLVTELLVSLPRVKFPIDVSGGVARFRHRRGELVRVAVELHVFRFERMLRTRLRGLVGTTQPEVWVGLTPGGATIAVAATDGAALAFDVLAFSSGTELRLVVEDARGIGLPRPALAIALEALGGLLGGHAKREGSTFVIDAVARRIARALLPDAGVRVPLADDVFVAAVTGVSDAWLLHLSRGRIALEPSPRVAAALENDALLRRCDDALVAGDLDAAREIAVEVMARAPRHAAACLRVADIDRVRGERAEAALAVIADAFGNDSPARAMLRAELLAQAGDVDVAANAFASAGESDPAPLLGARAFERAALLAREADVAASLLDRAIARAPTLTGARFRRLEKRLELGRLDDAFADAEELEAQARSPRARHDVWRRAADAFLRAGLRAKAGLLYERSLRFVPDDPAALAGLGRALTLQGKVARGTRLLVRAIEMYGDAEKAAGERDACVLDLSRALATGLDDKPAAIARLETIDDRSMVADEARALEARLRAELGDVAGAAFSWAKLRNVAESIVGATDLGTRARSLATLLVEAARFELDLRRDGAAAQRHLKTALRLAPHDTEAQALFRHAGALVAEHEGIVRPAPERSAAPEPQAPPAPAPSPPAAPVAEAPRRLVDLAFDDESADASLEGRADELTRKLQADPARDDIADELIDVLLKLGRSHEVFALVSARVEDATPERKGALRDKQRVVVGELAAKARAQGNEAEAALFESFARADD